MPATHTINKLIMQRRKSDKVLTDRNQNIYKSSECTYDKISEYIMKEMGMKPLDDKSFNEECNAVISPSSNLRTPTPKVQKIQRKSSSLSSSEDSPYKSFQDHLILFNKPKTQDPLGEDHFQKLSNEIILHIFKFLPKRILVKCSTVCKRWKYLSYDDSLWRRYDFGRKVINPLVLENLLTRGVQALRLAMSELKFPVISDYMTTLSQSSNWSCSLQYLDFSMATISAKGLAQILLLCFNLRKLSLENCTVNDDCCRGISQNKKLEALNMTMCSNLSSKSLCDICLNCSSLKEWNLAWTNLDAKALDSFLPLIPTSLRRLNLSGNRNTLNDLGLITVTTRCHDLIELDISDCSLLTDLSFHSLVKNCTKLQNLNTSRSYNIPTDCNRLLKELKNFRNLGIFRTLTDEALAALREYMPDVQINQHIFSTIARPTTGIRRTSIWGVRVRD